MWGELKLGIHKIAWKKLCHIRWHGYITTLLYCGFKTWEKESVIEYKMKNYDTKTKHKFEIKDVSYEKIKRLLIVNQEKYNIW